jgi:4,5-dihydroxyphthalate decarboxylase
MLLKLKIAIADYPHTVAIKNGTIPIEGVEPEFCTITPQIAAYRRMVRQEEFDVCELAPTTYLIARAVGANFIALPIFVTRHFHHGGLLVRPDANIHTPKDLEGKKVGVRAYSVTTGVWARGIFIEEYKMDSSKVTWVVDDEEHVTQLRLPENVIHAPPDRSLFSMMQSGEISAGFAANAGIGRSGAPGGGWKTEDTSAFPDMFKNPAALEADWYHRTGIYPMHATIVVKDAVLRDHPWVAKSLFDAFSRAKAEWLTTLHSGDAQTASDQKYRKLTDIVGPDPLPYGMAKNLATIEALQETALKQKLIPHVMPIETVFFDPEQN